MRKLLLNHTPLFRKLRQLSLLLTLLLALPQTAWGKRYTTTGNVIDATGNNGGTRFIWETSATETAEWRWVIDCEAGTVTSGISTLTFTLPAGKNITMSFGGSTSSTNSTNKDYTTLRKFTFVGLSNELTVSAALTQESTTYNFTGSNGVFTPSGNTNSIDMNGVLNVTITNNSGNSVTCTINSITVLTGPIISSDGLVWPENAEDPSTGSAISGITKNVSNNVTTLSGNLNVDDSFHFPLKRDFGDQNPVELNKGDNLNYDIAYSSSNTNVAEVSGGDVTIKGYGSTTITATLTENDYYSYAQPTYSYTLTNTQTFESYGITVAGTRVTAENANNIFNDGKVVYTHNDDGTGTLTLNGASLTGKIRISRAEALTIELIGANSIAASDSSAICANFEAGQAPTSAPSLIFKGEGYVTLTPGSSFPPIGGLSVDLTNGMYADGDLTSSTNPVSVAKKYDITVANTQVTTKNKDNVLGHASADVSFTPASSGNNNTNTLTLNGASFNNPIISNLDNLTILIQGDNDLANNQSGASGYISSTNTNAPLTLKGGTGDCKLRLDDNYGNAVISGFASVTFDGVYLSTSRAAKYVPGTGAAIKDLDGDIVQLATITTTHYYPLWVNSIQVYEGIIDDIYRDGQNSDPIRATFDPASNTLTLNGVSIGSSNGIESGLNSLIINLKGNNSINTNTAAHYSPICSMEAVPLTIQKAPDATNCELSLGSASGVPQMVKGFSSVSHTGLNFASKTGSSITDATTKDAVLSSATIYPLWVRGTMVTGINKDHILGASDTSVTFDGTNTLTLNGADISGMIESGLGNLTIHLTGNNKIQQSDSETSLITSSNSGVLTFETDATPGDLSFLNFGNPASVFSGTPWSGFSNVVYGTGLDYDDTNKKVWNISYPLTVAGTTVTSLNKNGVLGDNKVTFDPSSNTITLNGATINGSSGIVYNGTTDFTIALNGSNSIVNTTGNYAIVTNTTTSYSLKFEKATNASTAELALKWATGDKAISASDSILGSGLYWKPIAATQMNITDNPEFVIVGDYAIPDGTPVNGAISGTITYNATDKLLTISSFSQTFAQDAIKTSVSGLKVKLVGESTITCNNGGSAFTATTASASIQFVKNDANSKLVTNTDPLFNFANGAITYDELYYYYDSDNNQYIIKPKNSPTIKFVVRDQENNGSIPASPSDYTYVPDNGIQIPYATSYYAPKPVFSDGYVLTDSTRYVYSMSVDGVVEFELGGTNYYNSDKILYADNGKLNILKSGELTITCSFPGNNENEPCSASYTLKITRNFNNPFANKPAEQIYATYRNFDEDLTLPDGIVAYIVTGVSGNTVTTTAIGYLPQHTAVLLEKTGTTVGTTVTGYTGSEGNLSANLLDYAGADRDATNENYYVLYKNEFVKAVGDIAGKCFLDLSSVSFTRGAYGIGDGSTAIKALQLDAIENETWFDLQGRRIDKPTRPGLYIKNGKKVVVNNK